MDESKWCVRWAVLWLARRSARRSGRRSGRPGAGCINVLHQDLNLKSKVHLGAHFYIRGQLHKT